MSGLSVLSLIAASILVIGLRVVGSSDELLRVFSEVKSLILLLGIGLVVALL